MQTQRLFEILYLLLREKSCTAADLAARFGVSQRTIYRDVDTLSLSGIPVYTSRGKGGGIRLLEDFVLDQSLLNEAEQAEILAALQGLERTRGGDSLLLAKMSALFRKSSVNWVELDFSDWSYQNGALVTDLKRAILERFVVAFDYYNSAGEKSERRAEPIQLWFKHRGWYLKAYCLAKNDIRLFKLTRIRDLRVSETQFPQRDLLQSAVENPPVPSPARSDVTLRLKIAPEMTWRVHDYFDDGLLVCHEDGSFTVTVTWPEDEWVYGFLLSFGEYAEVLEPPHIREILREKLRKNLEKYL